MKQIFVFLAEGFEEIEALTVVDLCRRADIPVETVSITGNRQVTGSHQITVMADRLFEDTDFDKADMLVLPGGMPGTKNLKAYGPLIDLLTSFAAQEKKIAAVCAAPSILGSLGILKGKKACCFPGFEQELEGADVTQNCVEADGNIITSRGMGTTISFALAIVSVYRGEEEASQLGKKIIY